MTTDEKLAAILAAVQVDPGNRGLAKLFPVCATDFAAACLSIANASEDAIDVNTGFYIPVATPPAFETDGPLGAVFLVRAFAGLLSQVGVWSSPECTRALAAGVRQGGLDSNVTQESDRIHGVQLGCSWPGYQSFHQISLECPGPAADGRCYTMRGRDVTAYHPQNSHAQTSCISIGIGDGGNEIGMGKLPHELVADCVPNGDLIHCRVATDFLIVAGVSNWGAYALAAGVYVLRGRKPPADLFDPDREREILEVMVREGPLVDGVTGKQTATVDGLAWEEYAKPLLRIREILES